MTHYYFDHLIIVYVSVLCVNCPTKSRTDIFLCRKHNKKTTTHIFWLCSLFERPEKKRDRFSFEDEEFDRARVRAKCVEEYIYRERKKNTHTFFSIMRVHLVQTNSQKTVRRKKKKPHKTTHETRTTADRNKLT